MANTVISLKKSATPAATPSALANGELAINYADGKLFYKAANGTIVEFASGGGAESSDFGTINVGGTLLVSDVQGDILTITAGDNIVLTPDAGGDSFSISAPAVDDAFAKANTAQTDATNAFGKANTAGTDATNAFGQANTAGTDATNAFGQANSATTIASAAFDQANTSSALELYAENPSSPTAPSATGNNSVAIGDGAEASAIEGIAIGKDSDAVGTARSIGIGRLAQAFGTSSLSLGYSTSCTATEGNALGNRAQVASGTGATAIGKSYASGADSFAAAIATNSSLYGATGTSSVTMGYQAKASGSYSAAIGFQAQATNTHSIAIGRGTNSSGVSGSVAIGYYADADGDSSIALGYRAKSRMIGELAFASDSISGNNGDTQTAIRVLISDTTDATPEALTTNNSTASTNNQIILPNNSAYFFSGTIIARQDAASGTDMGAWEIKGAIRREGSAGTTTLVKSTIDEFSAPTGWSIALTADTTNGGLKIEVTGAAATNIRWVATVHTSEVTY